MATGGRDAKSNSGGATNPPAGAVDGENGADRLRLAVARQRRAIQRKAERETSGSVEPETAIPAGGGAPLPAGVRSSMERGLGADLGQVRIHTGADSAQAAGRLSARAFTDGNDVHFAAGQYHPGTRGGDRL